MEPNLMDDRMNDQMDDRMNHQMDDQMNDREEEDMVDQYNNFHTRNHRRDRF